MNRKTLALSRVYSLLEPGPVVLLVTRDEVGHADIRAVSWHMMVEFEPPRVACVLGGGQSYEALCATGECTINIPTVDLAGQVVGCGNTHAPEVDKFKRFGLTPVAARKVKAPLIDECFANLECRVEDDSLVERYGLFVLRVLKAWADPAELAAPKTLHHVSYADFMVAGEHMQLAGNKMR